MKPRSPVKEHLMLRNRTLYLTALLLLMFALTVNGLWLASAEGNDLPQDANDDATATAIALTETANANASATALAQTQAAQTAVAQTATANANASATAAAQTAIAQTAIAQQTEQAPMSVNRFEPNQITTGNPGAVSVFGANFTDQTKIYLVGFGLLETQFINSTYLIATLPNTIPAGGYPLEVADPVRGVIRHGEFRVNPPPPTDAPPPTERPLPTETTVPTETPVPSPIPGQPSLVVRNFAANPSAIAPGGTTTLTFEVVNQGSRVAQGVSVSVDAGGKFTPANGQSGATLPDIPIGAMTTVTLSVTAARDTPAGPGSIPITFSYFDFEGTALTSKATLSVTVIAVEEASQVTVSRYLTEPNPVIPGQAVAVEVLVTNSGNRTASQVLLRVSGETNVLLAGVQGDRFPLGDLAPGASASIVLPLMVSRDAKAGPQAQPVTISYLQDGEAKDTTSSITVNVAEVIKPEPLLLLEAYDVGQEILRPGDRFTFTMTLQNVGGASASDMLVTFGSVESSGGGTGGDGGSDTTGSGGSSTSTTPSSTFAPLGAGGTVYVGTLEGSGSTTEITQQFIVNGTVSSGIYGLPITLRYMLPDGTSAQDDLRASVVVVAPPLLQTLNQAPLPETVNIGEPFPIMIELSNSGTKTINLTQADVTAENGEVIDGASMPLTPMGADDDGAVSAMVMPLEAGPVSVTVTIRYRDDLNQPASIALTYTTEAVEPPPMPEEPPPVIEETPPPAEPTTQDTVGRLLLGFLGLGS
jgi:hypothetical protein